MIVMDRDKHVCEPLSNSNTKHRLHVSPGRSYLSFTLPQQLNPEWQIKIVLS